MKNNTTQTTHYYKITNAKTLRSLIPQEDGLIFSGDELFGRSDKEIEPGFICKGFSKISEIHPYEAIEAGIKEDLEALTASTPESHITARDCYVTNFPDQTEEEIDMHDTLNSADEHIDYILTGLEEGEVGSLVSAGGTGKSMLAITKGIQMALGKSSYLTQKSIERRVCYLSLEDKIKGVRNRLRKITRHLKLTMEEKVKVTKNFRVVNKKLIVGTKLDNLTPDPILDLFVGKQTPDLLIVDTARRLNHLNENDSSEMSAFISLLEEIGEELGCVVLLLHHTSKSSTGAKARGEDVGSEAARGSGAIVDNGRGTWYLSKLSRKEADEFELSEDDRQSYVTLDHTKCNAEKSQDRKILKRVEYGILEEVDISELKKEEKTNSLGMAPAKKKRGGNIKR